MGMALVEASGAMMKRQVRKIGGKLLVLICWGAFTKCCTAWLSKIAFIRQECLLM